MMDRVNRILEQELYRHCLSTIETYERDRRFCKHDMEHFLSVARLMLIKSLENDMDIPKDILYALALLHDIGRAYQYELGREHTRASALLARELLPQCGYDEEETEAIAYAIAAHNDEEACGYLSSLLQSADRESRNCFLCPASEDCYWPESRKNKGVVL